MTAVTLTEADALVAISASGKTEELIVSASVAQSYGAKVIAITAAGSALAVVADHPVAVIVGERPDTLTPTAARFAYLAVVDRLAAATGYARGAGRGRNLAAHQVAAQTHRQGQMLERLGD